MSDKRVKRKKKVSREEEAVELPLTRTSSSDGENFSRVVAGDHSVRCESTESPADVHPEDLICMSCENFLKNDPNFPNVSHPTAGHQSFGISSRRPHTSPLANRYCCLHHSQPEFVDASQESFRHNQAVTRRLIAKDIVMQKEQVSFGKNFQAGMVVEPYSNSINFSLNGEVTYDTLLKIPLAIIGSFVSFLLGILKVLIKIYKYVKILYIIWRYKFAICIGTNVFIKQALRDINTEILQTAGFRKYKQNKKRNHNLQNRSHHRVRKDRGKLSAQPEFRGEAALLCRQVNLKRQRFLEKNSGSCCFHGDVCPGSCTPIFSSNSYNNSFSFIQAYPSTSRTMLTVDGRGKRVHYTINDDEEYPVTRENCSEKIIHSSKSIASQQPIFVQTSDSSSSNVIEAQDQQQKIADRKIMQESETQTDEQLAESKVALTDCANTSRYNVIKNMTNNCSQTDYVSVSLRTGPSHEAIKQKSNKMTPYKMKSKETLQSSERMIVYNHDNEEKLDKIKYFGSEKCLQADKFVNKISEKSEPATSSLALLFSLIPEKDKFYKALESPKQGNIIQIKNHKDLFEAVRTVDAKATEDICLKHNGDEKILKVSPVEEIQTQRTAIGNADPKSTADTCFKQNEEVKILNNLPVEIQKQVTHTNEHHTSVMDSSTFPTESSKPERTKLSIQCTGYRNKESEQTEVIPVNYKWTEKNKFHEKNLPSYPKPVNLNPKCNPKLMPIISSDSKYEPTSDFEVTAEQGTCNPDSEISFDIINTWKQEIRLALSKKRDVQEQDLNSEEDARNDNRSHCATERKDNRKEKTLQAPGSHETKDGEQSFCSLEYPTHCSPERKLCAKLKSAKIRNVCVLNILRKNNKSFTS